MKTHLTAALVFTAIFAYGQGLSGKIIYQETYNRTFRGNEVKMTNRWELVFTDTIAICRWLPSLEEDKDIDMGGLRVQTRQIERREFYITYPKDRKVNDVRELLRKYFLVEDDFLNRKWKMTGKQGVVEGYPCLEATLTQDTVTHMAWFAPRLPLSIGPKEWRGLPGIILYMELNNGKTKISIESLDLNYKPKPEDFEKEKPKGTTALTWEEFEKLRDEKMAERKGMGWW